MAEDDNAETLEEQNAKKAAKHDSVGVADLEKVTDYVEEAEIGAQNIGDAIKLVNARGTKDATEKQLKESELSRVKINKEDVDLIMNELEVSRTVAERALREHKGNLYETLITLTD
ncbi:hypothetical protein HELRODRAFT_67931 [Helobdella robusta]|uniref:Nascent polypeptide-associated complex subunit alpha-like UBA domain-containing protein n=1 Tax=Helobdella robusta TaxID=6412 RepID=T1FZ80_HELRO|nr:hypothetical protein HELRODRAFT_67931 [Helobdella robusta]ESN96133.1 hypothetical protein HELRODRAFT_67931 [Helobdella robusta]